MLSGSSALVTGATGRIGRAIGLALREAGMEVLLHGRNPGRVALLQEEMGTEAMAGDLTRPEEVEAVRTRVARHGRLSVLTLGSGIYERSDDPAVLERMLAANLLGPYALLRALLPFLVAGQGQVVFLNSTQGLAASGGVGQFAATQHAMRAIADSLRDEVNAKGVRVLSLFLGRTASDRQRAIIEMACFQGKSMSEIAATVNESVANVRNHYYRGLKKLKDFLQGGTSIKGKLAGVHMEGTNFEQA